MVVTFLLNGILTFLGAFSVSVNLLVIKRTFFGGWKSTSSTDDPRHLQYFYLLFANSCLGLVSMIEGATYGLELPSWTCSLKALLLQIFGLASFCWCARIMYTTDNMMRNIFLWRPIYYTVSTHIDHLIGWGIPLFTVFVLLLIHKMNESDETFCWRALPHQDYTRIYATAIMFLLPHAIILAYLVKLSYFYFSIHTFNGPLKSTIQRVRAILFIVLGLRLLFFMTRVMHALLLERSDALINLLYFISPLILSFGDTLAFSILFISKHFTELRSTMSTASPTGDTGVTPDELETSHFIQAEED